MDLITLFSLLLYLGTFICGFLLDIHPERKHRARRFFVCWLYIFLCFGYMVGSDWDTYEVDYLYGYGIERYRTEPLSYFFFSVFPKIVTDFWIFCGVTKCFYLYTLIVLLKKLTKKWLSSLMLMMPFSLLFMLISNPLRYMIGLCFINIALLLIVHAISNENKIRFLWLKVIGLIIIATCFQNTCAVFLLILPLILLHKFIYRTNRIVLFLTFLFTILLTSDVSAISSVKSSINAYLAIAVGMRDLASWYNYEDNTALFSLGNLFKIVFLIIVLANRDKVVKSCNNGILLYGVSVIALFIERFCLLIPTAFRWAIPLDYFYIVYFIICFSNKFKYVNIIVFYAAFLLCKNLWFSYDLIPYSNSIPYIITGHKPYRERLQYNKDAYHKRTGEEVKESSYEELPI